MTQRKVQCWIFSRDRSGAPLCLLLKTNAARGNFWQPVTGTVEPHEGFFEAACREPQEETGFVFENPPLDSGFEFEFTSRNGCARERIYALYVNAAPVPRIDPKEHQDFHWIAPAQALSLLRFPSNVDGLKKTFKMVFERDL